MRVKHLHWGIAPYGSSCLLELLSLPISLFRLENWNMPYRTFFCLSGEPLVCGPTYGCWWAYKRRLALMRACLHCCQFGDWNLWLSPQHRGPLAWWPVVNSWCLSVFCWSSVAIRGRICPPPPNPWLKLVLGWKRPLSELHSWVLGAVHSPPPPHCMLWGCILSQLKDLQGLECTSPKTLDTYYFSHFAAHATVVVDECMLWCVCLGMLSPLFATCCALISCC